MLLAVTTDSTVTTFTSLHPPSPQFTQNLAKCLAQNNPSVLSILTEHFQLKLKYNIELAHTGQVIIKTSSPKGRKPLADGFRG